MDSLTQATLGGAIGEVLLGKKIGSKGAIIGAVVGTIPDLDIALFPFFDDLQRISLHRGYSHSLVFCIVGAFVFSYLLKKIKWTKEIPYIKLWLFNFLALFTHVLLDAFTTYGTQIFLPFTDWRVSFDSVNIVDPVYTLPLLTGLLLSVFLHQKNAKRKALPNNIGLIISSLYLIFTLAHKQHIEKVFHDQLEEQNILSFDLLTVPVKVGNVNWYGVAKDTSHLHIGKYSSWNKNNIDFHSFPINDQLLEGLNENLVDRMKWFAQGFYVVAKQNEKIRIYNMQCDMQGVRTYGNYKAPTAFYFEIETLPDHSYSLKTGMHERK
jgi:inner membrane protein